MTNAKTLYSILTIPINRMSANENRAGGLLTQNGTPVRGYRLELILALRVTVAALLAR